MGDVVLVEVFAVVGCLQPELAKSFPLGVRADDAVGADETCQSNPIKTLCIEDGCGVAHTFGKICEEDVSCEY